MQNKVSKIYGLTVVFVISLSGGTGGNCAAV